jgi:hypothetical protein
VGCLGDVRVKQRGEEAKGGARCSLGHRLAQRRGRKGGKRGVGGGAVDDVDNMGEVRPQGRSVGQSR